VDLKISAKNKNIQTDVNLPASKSISNRLLIIQALSDNNITLQNISDSDDTKVMLEAFASDKKEINIGHAGTSMRFLTAYYAATGQNKIMTGSERMKNRPIAELVNALNQLGAGITYLDKAGFPPIETSGNFLSGNKISINGSISSQYITALLLIAPTLTEGLTIEITGDLISSSYVALTLGLMQQWGIKSTWKDNRIIIPNQKYSGNDFFIESDWSGASYWYEIAALADTSNIRINGVTPDSLQGDAAISDIFQKLGLKTTFENNAAIISKSNKLPNFFEFDFINNPDVVQTLVVTLCLLEIPFRISGAQTLRIKETDRIAALQKEMAKMGFVIEETEPGVLIWDKKKCTPDTNIIIETYKDHRMALAFAPAALKIGDITIADSGVVSKSYPEYWQHLKQAGFEIIS
jgi:3-phosphoshikimate 1-carboxyvinyltransferase